MKSLEEIELEYQLLDYSLDSIENIDVAKYNLYDTLKSIRRDRRLSLRGKMENILDKLLVKVYKYIDEDIVIDLDVLEEDNRLIEQARELMRENCNYIEELILIINESNFQEVYKLFYYLMIKYRDNDEYIEDLRNGLYYAKKGITYQNSKYEDSTDAVGELFKKELLRLKEIKPVEKKKEI